jgi:hypothetical protein
VQAALVADASATAACAERLGAGGPADLNQAVRLSFPAAYRALPAWAMAAGRPPQPVDARIYNDVLWLLRRYNLRVSAGRESGHHTHGDGTAVDLVPAIGVTQRDWDDTAGRLARDLGWTESCGSSGARPACPLKPAIQWIGYDGYPSHGSPRTCTGGCPVHIHVSWVSGCYGSGALVAPCSWVMAFPVPGGSTEGEDAEGEEDVNAAVGLTRPDDALIRGSPSPLARLRSAAGTRRSVPSGWTASVRVAGLPNPLLPHNPTHKEVSDRVRASTRRSRRGPQCPGAIHRRRRVGSRVAAVRRLSRTEAHFPRAPADIRAPRGRHAAWRRSRELSGRADSGAGVVGANDVDAVVQTLVDRYGLSVRLNVAASIAGFSEDKVRELRRVGRFPGHRAGTKVMVFVPELVDWMRNGGEGQYHPSPTASGTAGGPTSAPRPRRKADRPAWMDRVRSGVSTD